jgi:cytochrome c-type biogenesis protein CcmH/NrfG
VSAARRQVDLQPSSGPAHAMLGQAYLLQGRFADAVVEFEPAPRPSRR